MAGAKFRRQRQLVPYIVDFYSASHASAVEVAGGHHGDPEVLAYDNARTV